MNESKPLFEHDCDRCIFLGSHTIEETQADLYWHDKDPTVIARYSSEPSDYSSGICFAFGEHSPFLKEAYIRAKEKNLVRPEIDLFYRLDQQVRGGFFENGGTIIRKCPEISDAFFDTKDLCEEIQSLLCKLIYEEK